MKQNIASAQTVDCQGDQDCLNLQTQIDALSKARAESEAATTPLQSQLSNMKVQLSQIESQLTSLADSITQRENDIQVRENKIATEQVVLDDRVKSYYIRSFLTSPLLFLFSSGQNSDIFKQLAYSSALAAQDQVVIKSVTGEIVSLLSEKDKLEKDKQNLASFQSQVNANAEYLNGVITQAVAYQNNLSSQIAQLSSQQEALIAAKLASLNIPHSAYAGQGRGCVDDSGVDPGFSPRFAFFTYGVPDRVGLNQYGAKGRAEAGQSYQDILNAYYNGIQITNMNTTSTNVTVNGTNDYGESFNNQQMTVEDYLTHLYEMPSDWPTEALKAQAVAARSYVMHAISSGQTTVAPNQSFQEVKQEQNDSSWVSAVNATSGQVMTYSGTPIDAWYSSTFGGYELSSGDLPGWNSTPWTKEMRDTSGSVSSFSDLQSTAYDRESPWFYCDWGSRSQYSNTAWLKPDEVADIVNVILLAQKDGSTSPHLSQVDGNIPDTWSEDQVKQELSSRGVTPFSSISNASINWDTSSGRTTTISFTGDAGSVSFDGNTFKQYFNVRAPANIQIVGPLFNVETK